MNESSRIGLIGRIARHAISHRRTTIVAWLAVMVAALGGSTAVGSHYTNNNSLKGTQSQRATDLLRREFPSQAGDTDQIVLHVDRGSVSDPAVRARISPMLARVSTLPHVTGVVSPYGPRGARQVSGNGKIAFATVTFDERANALPKAAVNKVISVAQSARTPGLDVELGGQPAALAVTEPGSVQPQSGSRREPAADPVGTGR